MDRLVCAAVEDEGMPFDPDRLELLWGEMGEERAEAFVRTALAELSRQVSALRAVYAAGETRRLGSRARDFARLADRAGMSRIAAVAGDVAICAGRGDRVALGATWGRLDRLSQAALGEVHLPPSRNRSS